MTRDPQFAARGWTLVGPSAADDVADDLPAGRPSVDPLDLQPVDLQPVDLQPVDLPPVDLTDDPEPQDPAAGVRHRRPSWWRRVGRGGRFVETWVPEPLRDSRIDPGRRGALILSLVAAIAAVTAAVGVWRDRPEPRPVQAISHSAVVADGSGAAPPIRDREGAGSRSASTAGATSMSARSGGVPSTDSPAPAVLAVSVTGAVRRPGLVRVPAGSRVADAIAAAGGITTDADVTGLNVATVLADGDSVVVGAAGAPIRSNSSGGPGPPGGTAGVAAGQPLDLNSADSAALEALPGVGPVMAGNIIAWREANGPFTVVDQLQEISGIGPARFAQLAPLVIVG